MTTLDNSLDAYRKRNAALRGRTGRPAMPCECIGCDATAPGRGIARALGWSMDQAGRSHLCPDCQRKRRAKLAAEK